MNKPTIETALLQRIPLPWRQSTCDGPTVWKVERQRPEDFTAEIYQRLKKYGMKEDDIRVLFYIKNEDYARIKATVLTPKDRVKIAVEGPHNPTADELEAVFRPEDDEPIPLVPADTAARTIEFSDGPSGAATSLIEFSDPPVPSAKIQITCHGYSLKQLKSIFTSLPDETVISGIIHISL